MRTSLPLVVRVHIEAVRGKSGRVWASLTVWCGEVERGKLQRCNDGNIVFSTCEVSVYCRVEFNGMVDVLIICSVSATVLLGSMYIPTPLCHSYWTVSFQLSCTIVHIQLSSGEINSANGGDAVLGLTLGARCHFWNNIAG